MLKSIIISYKNSLVKRPWTTQIITSGSLFAIGDILAQKVYDPLLGKKKSSYDWSRTGILCSYGSFVAGPSTFAWYKWLEKNIVMKRPFQVLITRVALDQILFAPFFIFVFISTMEFTSSSSMEQVRKKLNSSYFKTLALNYQIWPMVQLINFYAVPLNYRPILVNMVALGWNGYLSFMVYHQKEQASSDIVAKQKV